jgi:beta-lactamase class A
MRNILIYTNHGSLLKYFACLALVHACITPKSAAQRRPRNSRDDGTVSSRRGSQRNSLQLKIRNIAMDAHGKVCVACALPGDELSCDLNPNATPPMQSVFKLPLALAVLHHVEQGSLLLDQVIHFAPDDRILPTTNSPLQDRYPEANVDVSLMELLRLSVSLSDNVAADLLLRLVGGPKAVNEYVASIGVVGFHLEDGEHELHRDPMAQYRNWFTPAGAVQLLRHLNDSPPLSSDHVDLLLGWMKKSVKADRLKGELPTGTVVAHKAGSSGVNAGVAPATNDIGLITLPDGRVLAIAVFITDSKADERTREKVISRIARAAYDASLEGVSGKR